MDFSGFVVPPKWAGTCTSPCEIFSSRGFDGALSWLFPVQLSPVAEESFVCHCGGFDAGAGHWRDDGDLQPGECGAAKAAAVPGGGPVDADYAGGPLGGSGGSGVAELPGLLRLACTEPHLQRYRVVHGPEPDADRRGSGSAGGCVRDVVNLLSGAGRCPDAGTRLSLGRGGAR